MFEQEIKNYFIDLIEEVSFQEFENNYALNKLVEKYQENGGELLNEF